MCLPELNIAVSRPIRTRRCRRPLGISARKQFYPCSCILAASTARYIHFNHVNDLSLKEKNIYEKAHIPGICGARVFSEIGMETT